MATKIRLAEYSDLFAVNHLLHLMRKDAGENFPQPEYPAALHVILDRISDRMIWLAVDETDNSAKVVGMIALRVSTYDGAPSQRYLETVNFYVIPDARSKSLEDGKPVASGLIEAAKNTSVLASVAVNQWLPLIFGIDFGDDRVELKEMLVEKHGFKRTGGNFIRVPSEEDLPEEARRPPEAAE